MENVRTSNWDDWCGYTTLRTVKLRDWRLGVLYYAFLCSVFCYVVGYNLVYQQLYRKSVPIVGTARIQLRLPDPKYSIPAERTSFCGVGPGRIYKGKNGIPFSRNPCKYWDNYDSVFPSLEDSGWDIVWLLACSIP